MFLGEIFLMTKPPLTPIKKATGLPKADDLLWSVTRPFASGVRWNGPSGFSSATPNPAWNCGQWLLAYQGLMT